MSSSRVDHDIAASLENGANSYVVGYNEVRMPCDRSARTGAAPEPAVGGAVNHVALKVLIIRDDFAVDAELTVRELSRGSFAVDWQRVDSAADMAAALQDDAWDIVLSDFSAGFNGLAALALVQASARDLPFVLVSGAVGEDIAVEVMRAGAHDYVAKDRLSRLAPAVVRELREALARAGAPASRARVAEDGAGRRADSVGRRDHRPDRRNGIA